MTYHNKLECLPYCVKPLSETALWFKSSKYLSEMKTGKTYQAIEQTGEKERQRENGLRRERYNIGGKRRVAWVDFDSWLKSIPEYF
jgi:hypothetical protein